MHDEPSRDLSVEAIPGGWRITGDIDASSAPTLAQTFEAATIEAGAAVVLDVGGVSFMDSSGLRVLLDLKRRADGGSVVLRNTPRSVERLLEVTGLTSTFDLGTTP